MSARKFETTLAGRPLVIETGHLAQFANGSCLVRYGDTVIMSSVTASASPRPGIDFFPLSVDYEEKMYSVGKFPGGFIKRESRPKDKEILVSRLIDRPMRPLFDKAFGRDIQIVPTCISSDMTNPPDILAVIASSAAVAGR